MEDTKYNGGCQVTHEQIDRHIEEYKRQREQTRANLNALEGAIQALEKLKEEQSGDTENRA
jgi:prefoldin subunit 5